MSASKSSQEVTEPSLLEASVPRISSRMFRSPSLPLYISNGETRTFTENIRDYPVAVSYETQLRLQMIDSSLQASTSGNASDDLLFESENVEVPSVEVVYEGSRFERLDAAFEARCVDQLNAARASSVASLSSVVSSPPSAPAPSSSSDTQKSSE